MTSRSGGSLSGTGAASAQIASACAISAPSSAAMAPSPAGTARCMVWPRSFSSRAASGIEKAPAAASAEYSPSEWPATTTAFWRSVKPPSFSSTRSTASEWAISAGWVFSVRIRSSPGPSNMSLESFWFRVSSTSSNTSRAAEKAAARSRPMPTAWLPWPGKMKA